MGQYIPEKATGAVGRGQQGDRTKAAQDALVRAGFLEESSGANKGRDGMFGPKTEAAVRAFQKAKGLPVTGQVDDRTSKALLDTAPEGDPPGGKLAKEKPRPKPGRAPGEPKPDGTQATADTIVAKRMEHFGLEPRNARPKARRLMEDQIPETSPDGGKIVDFNGSGTGVVIYSDGSVYDGFGWQPGKPAKRKGSESKTAYITQREVDTARTLRELLAK